MRRPVNLSAPNATARPLVLAVVLSCAGWLSVACGDSAPRAGTGSAGSSAASSASANSADAAARGGPSGNPSSEAAAGANAASKATPKPPEKPLVVRVHDRTERLEALCRAIETLDRAQAEPLLDAARDAGPDEPLLRARFLALDKAGTMEALRLVETVRAADAQNPEVYATAAEIYAANDAFDTAWREIERGQAACGDAVELVRARGIAWLCREGGAKKGVEHLERARAADPKLPFVDRALAQGHLLLAKQAQQAEKIPLAAEHARKALALAPDDVDGRRLYSELLSAQGDFPGAIAVVQGLVGEGQPLGAELASLHKKGGIAALLENDRARAIVHFRAARAHGLSDEELSSGAIVLSEDARKQIDLAVEALKQRDSVRAEACLREALLDEPDSLAARHHLALVLYGRGQDAEAAALWRSVLETARAEKIDLPDPVHLSLSAALLRSGDRDGARRVLEEFLALEPNGEWAERTRAQLATFQTGR